MAIMSVFLPTVKQAVVKLLRKRLAINTSRMEGPGVLCMNEDTKGMIPRAVEQIYQSADKLKEKGWAFDIEGQYLEIYNETIRDLIGAFDPSKKHEIKHTGYQGKTIVTDITTGSLCFCSS